MEGIIHESRREKKILTFSFALKQNKKQHTVNTKLFVLSAQILFITVSGVYMFQNDPNSLIMTENFLGKLFAIINMASEQSFSYLIRTIDQNNLNNNNNNNNDDIMMMADNPRNKKQQLITNIENLDPLQSSSLMLDELDAEMESTPTPAPATTTTTMRIQTKVKNRQKNKSKPKNE